MNTVTVDKEKLLEALKANRLKHIEEYKVALVGWHVKLQEWAKKAHELVTSITPEQLPHFKFEDYAPTKPTSFEAQYDQAISMLTWSTAKDQTLSIYEFNAYVNDDWEWTHGFKTITQSYQ